MVNFEVKKRTGEKFLCRFEESAKETTLQRFLHFKLKIEPQKPKSLIQYEQAKDNDESELVLKQLSVQEITTDWNLYYVKFISYWSGMPEEYAVELSVEEMVFLYKTIDKTVSKFKYDESITSFKFKGNVFYYPKSSTAVFDKSIEYFRGARYIDLVESLQIEQQFSKFKAGQWQSLPYIISILCKKKDEQLPLDDIEREAFYQERVELFKDLPLSDALNLCFFLSGRKNIWQKDSSRYLGERGAHQAMGQLRFGKSGDGTFMLRMLHRVGFLKGKIKRQQIA